MDTSARRRVIGLAALLIALLVGVAVMGTLMRVGQAAPGASFTPTTSPLPGASSASPPASGGPVGTGSVASAMPSPSTVPPASFGPLPTPVHTVVPLSSDEPGPTPQVPPPIK